MTGKANRMPGFTAETALYRADGSLFRRAPVRRRASSAGGDATLIVPAARCEMSGALERCCQGSFCCLWNADNFIGCGRQ